VGSRREGKGVVSGCVAVAVVPVVVNVRMRNNMLPKVTRMPGNTEVFLPAPLPGCNKCLLLALHEWAQWWNRWFLIVSLEQDSSSKTEVLKAAKRRTLFLAVTSRE
jgi:hypothetical protein